MFKRSAKPRTADLPQFSAEILADVAHELRAPLGGIEAMIELLSMTNLDASQERLILGLRAASDHLRAVANDVLNSGQATPSGAPAGREAVVGEAVEAFAISARARALSRGVEFLCDIGAHCAGAVVADGVALRQILENLVDNAMRYSVKGSVILRLSPELDESELPRLRFDVLDQGPGLSEREARKIFGRRVTLPGRPGGAGLGLSIVAALVESLGGDCGAQSRSDCRGARLWFSLPVTGYLTGQSPALPPADSASAGNRLLLPVLVVDDHPSSRLVLQTVLEHMGFAVETTGVPAVAIELAACKIFGAVFTDMMMPDMDGCALVEAIRALPPPFNLTPVVGVTGRVSAEDKRRLLAAGGQVVVEKPITIAALRKAVSLIGLSPAEAAKGAA